VRCDARGNNKNSRRGIAPDEIRRINHYYERVPDKPRGGYVPGLPSRRAPE